MKLLLSAVHALLLILFAAANGQKQVAAARTGAAVCQLPLDTGNSCPTDQAGGPSSFRRWYYDSETGKCATFSWTRCGGNENRFRSKTQCERRCVLTTASNNEDSSKSEHDNQRPDDAHFANIKSRSSSRRCPPVKCGDDADSHQCPSGTSPVFSQNENGCPLCKCVPGASDSDDVAPSAPETTPLPLPSTTTTAEVTCPPISCDESSCPGPILLRIDDDTGCPVCQCTSSVTGNDATDTQHHGDVTTPSYSPPKAVVKCPQSNCFCAGQRIVDPETGCETCSCENSAEETVEKPMDVSHHQQPTESSVETDADCKSRCDDQCREAGTARDQSAACDVTACACVPDNENTVGDDHVHDAPALSSACPDRPVDCADFCGDDAVATSSVDEFGCDICTCSAVLSNSFTQITEAQAPPLPPLPSPDSVDCPEVDCGQLDCNELGGFAVDETTGCQLCACRNSAVTDNTDEDEANRHVQCLPCADPTIVCSEGFEVDAATGCETCECRHQPIADQTLNDYGELVPAAPLQCDPETECSGDSCVQAIDPQTGCHVCLCDDDNGQQGTIGRGLDRTTSDWDDDNRIDPPTENPESACPEVRCRQDCDVITDDRGCVSECRCVEVEQEPEVKPECPEHRCNCDSDDFETALSVDENGCQTCYCMPRTRSAPRVHDDRHHSTNDVNENDATEHSTVDSEHHRRHVDPAVMNARKVLCSLAAEHGPCTADITRFHYDPTSKSCKTFKYGGCRGNANNFRTEQDCRQYCEPEVNAQKNERRAWYKRILGFSSR